MTTVTGLTADRMLEIEAASVVGGNVVVDDLILTKHDGSTINAGDVRGPVGAAGPPIPKVGAFPGGPTDGDVVIRTDLPDDPMYKYTDGAWEQTSPRSVYLFAVAGAALLNGWTARNTIKLFKDPAGEMVTIPAVMLNGNSSTSSTALTLPVGFRPIEGLQVPGARGQTSSYNSPRQLEMIIDVTGVVRVTDDSENAVAGNLLYYTMLPTVSFPIV